MTTLELIPFPAQAGSSSKEKPTRIDLAGLKIIDHFPVLHLAGSTLKSILKKQGSRDFIDRVFTLDALQSLELNLRHTTAHLHFLPHRGTTKQVLRELAEAMRLHIVPRLRLYQEELILDQPGMPLIQISRYGQELTFWKFEPTSPTHFRLSHPLLESEEMCRRVLLELGTVPEITRKLVSPLRRNTLHVWVQPHRLEPHYLIEGLDAVLAEKPEAKETHPAHRREEWLVNTNLILAPVTEFLFPPLGLANAFLVFLINAPHLSRVNLDLRRGRANLHLLYLSIGVLTLLTFSFLAAAVMYWFLSFWPRQSKSLKKYYQAHFLARYQQRPRQVWVEQLDRTLETKLKDVTPSSVLILTAGDTIPGDGIVLKGSGEVDDSLVTGSMKTADLSSGDSLYAGTRLISGELKMRLDVLDREQTIAGKLAAWHRQNFYQLPPPSEQNSLQFAEFTVLPVLALGLLALTRGGLSMAKAVIRPDYLSGPQLAEDFLGLASLIRAADEGILIPNSAALESLRSVDCIVFDDSVPWRLTSLGTARFVEMLHHKNFPEVVFLAENDSAGIARQGFDTVHFGFTTEAKRAYIAQRQSFDHTVLYVGNCSLCTILADQADQVISVLEAPHLTPVGHYPTILGADLIKIYRLLVLAEQVSRELNLSQKISMVPNGAAAFGALYLGGNVDISVLLTNLGTLANYLRYRSYLELALINRSK